MCFDCNTQVNLIQIIIREYADLSMYQRFKKEDTLKRGGYLPFSLETNQQDYINFQLMEVFFQKPTHINSRRLQT